MRRLLSTTSFEIFAVTIRSEIFANINKLDAQELRLKKGDTYNERRER